MGKHERGTLGEITVGEKALDAIRINQGAPFEQRLVLADVGVCRLSPLGSARAMRRSIR